MKDEGAEERGKHKEGAEREGAELSVRIIWEICRLDCHSMKDSDKRKGPPKGSEIDYNMSGFDFGRIAKYFCIT